MYYLEPPQRKSNPDRHTREAVIRSAQYSYNPTNLAVETSLKSIFDEFQPMISSALRHPEEYEPKS